MSCSWLCRRHACIGRREVCCRASGRSMQNGVSILAKRERLTAAREVWKRIAAPGSQDWGVSVGAGAQERMAAADPRLREQSWRARARLRSAMTRTRRCERGQLEPAAVAALRVEYKESRRRGMGGREDSGWCWWWCVIDSRRKRRGSEWMPIL